LGVLNTILQTLIVLSRDANFAKSGGKLASEHAHWILQISLRTSEFGKSSGKLALQPCFTASPLELTNLHVQTTKYSYAMTSPAMRDPSKPISNMRFQIVGCTQF